MSKEVTLEEYRKACLIKQRFESLMDTTVQVSVTYNATVSATVKMEQDMTKEEMLEELKGGVAHYIEKEDGDEVDFGEIIDLTVDGITVFEKK